MQLFMGAMDVCTDGSITLTLTLTLILGMQLFMGAMDVCTDGSILTKEDCHAAPPPPPTASQLPFGRALGKLGSSDDTDHRGVGLSGVQGTAGRTLYPAPSGAGLSTAALRFGDRGWLHAPLPHPLVAWPSPSPPPLASAGLPLSGDDQQSTDEQSTDQQLDQRLEQRLDRQLATLAGPVDSTLLGHAHEHGHGHGHGHEHEHGHGHGHGRGHGQRRRLKGGGGSRGGNGASVVQWGNGPWGSFDNFGSAMLLLYVMSTGDGWDMSMYMLMDTTSPGRAPSRNDNSPLAFFAIAWMFIGSFLALNLFVGAVVDNFNRIKHESDGSATETPEQQQWKAAMKARRSTRAQKAATLPTGHVRAALWRVVHHRLFDGLISFVIVLNVLVMAGDYWGIEQDERAHAYYTEAMAVFGYIYYIEAAFKLTALGLGGYLGDAW